MLCSAKAKITKEANVSRIKICFKRECSKWVCHTWR